MENKQQQPMDYERPTVPPATPPTIDRRADAQAAAELAKANGDSDFPGRTPSEVHFRLKRRAQLLLAHELVDRFAHRGVEGVRMERLAVHFLDQVRRHLAGTEARHAH